MSNRNTTIEALAGEATFAIAKPGAFGLAHIKKEGAAVHPDDIEAPLTLVKYQVQLQRYVHDTGDANYRFVTETEYKQYLSDVSAARRSPIQEAQA